MLRVGPRSQACGRWGPRKGPPRPSMAAPTTPQGSREHSVLDVMNCKLNTTHPPARLPSAQAPTRPGTSGIYGGSPLLETLGPGQAYSGERGGGRGACTAEKGRTPRPGRGGGRVPGAPPQPPSTGTHQCSSSSGWAPAASPGHAWHRGPRGLSDWFPKAPQLLQEKEEMPTVCPHLGPWSLHSSTPRHHPRYRGGVPLHPQGGPPDVCRMRLPIAKDVPAAPCGRHEAPDVGTCPAPHREAAGQWGRACGQPTQGASSGKLGEG